MQCKQAPAVTAHQINQCPRWEYFKDKLIEPINKHNLVTWMLLNLHNINLSILTIYIYKIHKYYTSKLIYATSITAALQYELRDLMIGSGSWRQEDWCGPAGLPSPIKRIMSSRSCCTKLLCRNEIPAQNDRANTNREILKRTWQSRCRTALTLIFTEILDQLTHYLMYFIDCLACFAEWNVSRNRALRLRYNDRQFHT